jgi:hypothetical protein
MSVPASRDFFDPDVHGILTPYAYAFLCVI